MEICSNSREVCLVQRQHCTIQSLNCTGNFVLFWIYGIIPQLDWSRGTFNGRVNQISKTCIGKPVLNP
jgi:hypothetical protein